MWLVSAKKEKITIVLKEHYKNDLEILTNCENAGLIPRIIGSL